MSKYIRKLIIIAAVSLLLGGIYGYVEKHILMRGEGIELSSKRA